jgi:hypothetical protein
MLGGLVTLIVTGVIAYYWAATLNRRYPVATMGRLRSLFIYHCFLSFVYYLYAMFNRSDSRHYFLKVNENYRGDSWFDYYGTSTTFVEFVSYPFIKFLGFNYDATMVMFAFFGYLGFVYMYIFFKENIKFNHEFLGIDLITLCFFLPNLHFWSGSLGKGALIFLGIALYFFGLSKVRQRLLYIIIGGLIIYHVRPHVMLVILVGSAIGFVFSSKGVSIAVRIMVILGACVALFFIYEDVLTLVGVDEEEFLTQGVDFSHRIKELSKATSGIDISNYSLPEQVFAFLYRPLFFDAPGILGLIVSIENVFYLLITLRIFSIRGLKFMISGSFLIKSAFLSFLAVSIALAQISSNLGLAIRQKSQVMILFLFVIISFLDQEKLKQYKAAVLRRKKREKMLAAKESNV